MNTCSLLSNNNRASAALIDGTSVRACLTIEAADLVMFCGIMKFPQVNNKVVLIIFASLVAVSKMV